jgi:hypothetical protein
MDSMFALFRWPGVLSQSDRYWSLVAAILVEISALISSAYLIDRDVGAYGN